MKINNILILFIIFDYIYSLNEPKKIEFDVETPFDDKNNNEFSLYYDNDIFPFIVKSNSKKNKKYDIYCDGPNFSSLTDYIGLFYVIRRPVIGSYIFKIQLGEGTLWIHPMNNTINIDFSEQCYGITDQIYLKFDEYKSSMKYLVSNLKKNITAYFSYEGEKLTDRRDRLEGK